MWGQHVAAHDVWLGKLRGAMLVKETGVVTHLFVKRGLGRGRLYIIPMDGLKRWDEEAIYTKMTLEEALQQAVLKRLEGEQFIVALTPKTSVLTADGKRLKMRGIRISSTDHSMEWLVLSKRVTRKRLLLPVDRVSEFSTGKVVLDLERSRVSGMPAYRRDVHVEADLRERLTKSSRVPQSELRGVTLKVEEGTVAFRGNVKSRHTVEALRYETRRVRGASSLLLDLSCDAEMELEIAASLAEHTRGNGGPLQVSSMLGEVKLMGHLPGEDVCAELDKAASSVAGVRSVELASG